MVYYHWILLFDFHSNFTNAFLKYFTFEIISITAFFIDTCSI